MAEVVRGSVSIIEDGVKADVLDLSTNNALAVAIVDSSGNQVTSFGGSGGTSATDDSTFTPASGTGTPIMGFADETAPDSVDEGDVGVVRMTLTRALHVNLRDAAGAEVAVGGGTQYTEDAAAAANPVGTALILVREDARAGSLTSADGDNVAARGNNKGELYVIDTDANAKLTTITGNVDGIEGLLTTIDGDTGVLAGSVYVEGDTDASIAGTPILWEDTSDTLRAVSAAKPLPVSVIAALPAGSNNVGDVDVASIAAGDTTIGRVKITDGTDVVDVLDLASTNPLAVAIVDGAGDQITSFGGGTQYTEDAAAAANPTGTALIGVRADALAGLTSADGDNVAARMTDKGELYVKHVDAIPVTDNAGSLTVDGTVSVTGVATLAEQQTQTTSLATIAGDTTDIEAAVELLDDTVKVLGTDTYTEATSKGLVMAAVRRDADTTLADTTNEFAPLQVDASGRLKVEAFSGETLPVSLASTTVTGTVAVTQSGTWDEVGINDSGNSITVDNGGTFATQVDGAALTALQKIDDPVLVDDAAFTPGTSSVMMAGFEADEASTDSVDEGDAGAARMTLDRKVITQPQPHIGGGLSTFRSLDLDETEEEVKATAGQLYTLWFTNTATSTRWLKFYNATAANVTVGTTTPVLTIGLPGNTSDDISGVFSTTMGWAFDTAITVAATTGVADNDTGAPGANEVIVNIGYK